MECIIKYLGAGKIYKYPHQPAVALTISNFNEIVNFVVPLFNNNPLSGIKLLDYLDWCKVINIINSGKHLTANGLYCIKQIQAGMNASRDPTNI